MDTLEEIKKTVTVLPYVVKQFFDQLAQQMKGVKDNQKLPIELTNTTGTYLHDINDDCLLEIFSVKSLTLLDLCSLAMTCTRFKQIAERVFRKQLRIEKSNIGNSKLVSRRITLTGLKRDEMKRVYKSFGSILPGLSIKAINSSTATKRSTYALRQVTKYCVDTVDCFKKLKICDMKIPKHLTVTLKPTFKQLQLLELHDVTVNGDKTLFADFDSLIELSLMYVTNDRAVMKNIFPKLERFTYKGKDERLSTFISRHTSLKKLDLLTDLDGKSKIAILQVIGNSCNELEEFSMNIERLNASSVLPFEALKSVKILKLRYASCQDLSFIPAMTKLHDLQLVYCVLPTESNQFAFLSQLTKLQVCTYDDLDVVDLISRLINLKELTFPFDSSLHFALDEKMYSKIVSVVNGRPNVLTLKCKFNFDYNSKNGDKNQRVRLLGLDD